MYKRQGLNCFGSILSGITGAEIGSLKYGGVLNNVHNRSPAVAAEQSGGDTGAFSLRRNVGKYFVIIRNEQNVRFFGSNVGQLSLKIDRILTVAFLGDNFKACLLYTSRSCKAEARFPV